MSKPIVLEGKLPSSSVDGLVRQLKARRGKSLRIDASQVRMIGARVAETLVRFKAKVEAAGGTVTVDPSTEFAEDLRILGLHEQLLGKEVAK